MEKPETAPNSEHVALIERKDALRARHLENRRMRSSEERALAGQQLAQHDWESLVSGNLATCYASMAIEPSTNELRELLRGLNKQVLLPIMQKGRALAWGFDSKDLEVNNFGIAEPTETDVNLLQASALIIPALGAGFDGSRIGRGAGYYDRALENLPLHHEGGPLRIVVVFDDEVYESVPHEVHDQPVDVIVTPTKIFHTT